MRIQVSMMSETPAYEQIRMQIKESVLAGALAAGTQLPSIRLMAKDLNVGIITVKRAYEELENENIIISIQGKGTFVNQIDKDAVKKMYKQMLKENLYDIKNFSDVHDVSKEEIINLINEVWSEVNE